VSVRVGVLLSWVLALGACGGSYGGDAHGGQSAYVPPDRAYRLWYATPPWVLVESRDGHAAFRVGGGAASDDSGAVPSVIALSVDERADTTAQGAVAEAVAAAQARGDDVAGAAQSVVFADGATGFGAAFGDETGYYRVAAATLADGRAVVLTFTATSAIAMDPDITDLLARFEPRAVGP
jgi:hypothetical protein